MDETPEGAALLALDIEAAVGCAALRRFDATNCEMKRVFVPTRHQGGGIRGSRCLAHIEFYPTAWSRGPQSSGPAHQQQCAVVGALQALRRRVDDAVELAQRNNFHLLRRNTVGAPVAPKTGLDRLVVEGMSRMENCNRPATP
jgi:hypothetical protein